MTPWHHYALTWVYHCHQTGLVRGPMICLGERIVTPCYMPCRPDADNQNPSYGTCR